MKRKTRAASFVLAALTGLMLVAAPAFAEGYGPDHENSGISVGRDATVNAAPWQICGSNVGGVLGGHVPVGSPATSGDCENAETSIYDPGSSDNSGISVADGANVNILPWQICGSNVGGVLGGLVPIGSPATSGDCNNAETSR